MKHILLATVLCLATTSTASAQFSNLSEGWSGEASATGSRTTGNTDTFDFGLGLRLEKEADAWRHKLRGNADFGEVNNDTTRERYSIGYQLDRDITDRLYAFGNGDYYRDEFGAFSSGYFLGGGLGYRVILPDPIGWNLEGGAGFRSQTEQDTVLSVTELGNGVNVTTETDIDGETNGEFGLRGFSDFDYDFNDNVAFYNDTEIIWSDSDTYVWNEAGITAQLWENWAARASYRVDYHSNPPAGLEDTDTITRVGLVYTIK